MSTETKGAPSGDAASAQVSVAVPVEVAFDVFTREIDLWWQKGPRFRIGGRKRGHIHFEPGLGGRLFETFEAGRGTRTIEVGTVTVWEPPSRLAFEWRGVNFAVHEKTLVDVRFAPSATGTIVTVRHSGFAALREGHPVRHGLVGPEFSRSIGLWWGDLMTSLREHAATRRSE